MSAWANDATAAVAALLAGDTDLRRTVIGQLARLSSSDGWDQDVALAASTIRDAVSGQLPTLEWSVENAAAGRARLEDVAWPELGETMLLLVLRDEPSVR